MVIYNLIHFPENSIILLLGTGQYSIFCIYRIFFLQSCDNRQVNWFLSSDIVNNAQINTSADNCVVNLPIFLQYIHESLYCLHMIVLIHYSKKNE